MDHSQLLRMWKSSMISKIDLATRIWGKKKPNLKEHYNIAGLLR